MDLPGLLGHNTAVVSITLITMKFKNKSKFQFKYFSYSTYSNRMLQNILPKHKTY